MNVKPSLVTINSVQDGKILGDAPSSISKSNSIRSPLLAKTSADIVDFFNAGEQEVKIRE